MTTVAPTPISLRARLMRQAARWLIRTTLCSSAPAARRRMLLDKIGMASHLPSPPGTQINATTFRGVAGEWVRNRCVTPQRTVLYFHGGGYLVGSAAIYRDLTSRIARSWQAQVAFIEYRLAPENRFPAATDDVLAAYRALLEQGIAADSIVLAGDSAGGGLVMACALQIRDAGLPPPAALVMFSPWVDLTLSGDSAQGDRADDMLTAPTLRAAVQDYLGETDSRHPLASPLFADLRGLPRTLIQATDTEILADDARRLHAALTAAGTASQLRIWPNLFHVWQIFAGKMPESTAALNEVLAFLDRDTPE